MTVRRQTLIVFILISAIFLTGLTLLLSNLYVVRTTHEYGRQIHRLLLYIHDLDNQYSQLVDYQQTMTNEEFALYVQTWDANINDLVEKFKQFSQEIIADDAVIETTFIKEKLESLHLLIDGINRQRYEALRQFSSYQQLSHADIEGSIIYAAHLHDVIDVFVSVFSILTQNLKTQFFILYEHLYHRGITNFAIFCCIVLLLIILVWVFFWNSKNIVLCLRSCNEALQNNVPIAHSKQWKFHTELSNIVMCVNEKIVAELEKIRMQGRKDELISTITNFSNHKTRQLLEILNHVYSFSSEIEDKNNMLSNNIQLSERKSKNIDNTIKILSQYQSKQIKKSEQWGKLLNNFGKRVTRQRDTLTRVHVALKRIMESIELLYKSVGEVKAEVSAISAQNKAMMRSNKNILTLLEQKVALVINAVVDDKGKVDFHSIAEEMQNLSEQSTQNAKQMEGDLIMLQENCQNIDSVMSEQHNNQVQINNLLHSLQEEQNILIKNIHGEEKLVSWLREDLDGVLFKQQQDIMDLVETMDSENEALSQGLLEFLDFQQQLPSFLITLINDSQNAIRFVNSIRQYQYRIVNLAIKNRAGDKE